MREPLAPTRWKLRAAIKTVNQCLEHLHFEKHPDKTYIGRIAKGFDFLGFHFSLKEHATRAEELLLAKIPDNTLSKTKQKSRTPTLQPNVNLTFQSLQQYLSNMTQLYEQNAASERIGQYYIRWLAWVQSHILSTTQADLLYVTIGTKSGLLSDFIEKPTLWC